MTTPETVPAFVVTAVAVDKTKQEIGMFYRVVDADNFVSKLGAGQWHNVQIEPRQVPATDVHPAHHELFPKVFKAAKK